MQKLDNFSLTLQGKEYRPLVVGGMGVDISSSELALAAARLGAVGHISDAMAPYVADRKFNKKFQQRKFVAHRDFKDLEDKNGVKWDTDMVYEASLLHVGSTMEAKRGTGGIFVNVMEKLGMGAPQETLRARLKGALDAGVDGITLSAGLHNGTMQLMEDNPRFRDAAIGIIVSSSRALKIFLRSASRVNRLPDYIVVEGPLAGGHLGFGVDDWQQFSLKDIVEDVLRFLKENDLSIPVIPAGGVFTGTDAVEFIEMGASAVQVATRFTITKECGLPAPIKQEYLRSQEQDVEVNMISPTGYAMRMLKSSPALRSNIKPNCESLGYILDKNGKCGYHEAYKATGVDEKGRKLPVTTKMCICYHFMNFQCYTCGHYVYRLKNTTYKLPDGSYYLPPAEHIINDYLNSVDHKVALPVQEAAQKVGRLVVLEAY